MMPTRQPLIVGDSLTLSAGRVWRVVLVTHHRMANYGRPIERGGTNFILAPSL